MKILIATDAWSPQVNGVVRTLQSTIAELEKLGHTIRVIQPGAFRTIPCPTYPEIRLAWTLNGHIGRALREFEPDAIHLATEGPIGVAVRAACRRRGWPFTTAYSTKFPEYLEARFRLPVGVTYAALRWFHGAARGVMVATNTVKAELEARGFRNVVRWTRGVDLELFRPGDKEFLTAPRPILMYVGRVAVEKNLEAFLRLDLPGTKYIVGDGPQRGELERKFPGVKFVGMKRGAELAQHYAAADVFVMPSLTETFGLVMLEALACGVPVAAFPAPGALDLLQDAPGGALDADLGQAVRRALGISAKACRETALRYSWEQTARTFVTNLAPRGRG